MNNNIIKDSNKMINLLFNILCKNTTVNFYERKCSTKRLELNIGPIFCGGMLKEPIKAKTFHNRNKFDGKCQYNIEFDFHESQEERIEIKKHYNFSQNYIYIGFYLSKETDLKYILGKIMWPAFKKYKIADDTGRII